MAYTPSVGRVFYISPSGNNNNDGQSPARAWQTITKVNAATVLPGDTFLFEGGQSFTGATLTPKGGSSSGYVTYSSYGLGKAIILGDNRVAAIASDVSYCVISELIFKGINQPTTGWNFDGMYFQVGYGPGNVATSNIAVTNCEFYGFTGQGLGFYSKNGSCTITNILVEGCEFRENMNGCYFYRCDVPTALVYINVIVKNCKAHTNLGLTNVSSEHTGSGIVLASVNGGLVERCEAFNNGWQNGWTSGGPFAIWCYDSTAVIMQNNEAHNNGTGTGSARKDGGGFNIDGGCQNCIIQGNYAHENAGAGFALYEYGSARAAFTGNSVRYNIGIGNARYNNDGEMSIWSLEAGYTSNRVHNNLFVCNGDAIAGAPSCINFVSGTVALSVNVFNNIFIADGSNAKILGGSVQGTWSNNYFYALNSGNLNYSTGGTTGDPQIVYYTKIPPTIGAVGRGVQWACHGYKLKAASGCINTGLGTLAGYTFPTRDFWNNPTPVGTINIGPHEIVT